MAFTITNISQVSQGPFGFITQQTLTAGSTFTVTNALLSDFVAEPNTLAAIITGSISITVNTSVFTLGPALEYLNTLGSISELTYLAGSTTSSKSFPVVVASDQSIIPISAPLITKATQGANGFTVQHLKDSGSNQTN